MTDNELTACLKAFDEKGSIRLKGCMYQWRYVLNLRESHYPIHLLDIGMETVARWMVYSN